MQKSSLDRLEGIMKSHEKNDKPLVVTIRHKPRSIYGISPNWLRNNQLVLKLIHIGKKTVNGLTKFLTKMMEMSQELVLVSKIISSIPSLKKGPSICGSLKSVELRSN